MSKFVHLVCDYAPGDLAWAEILSALSDSIPSEVRLFQTSVASFDTVALGFIIAQLAGRTRPLDAPKGIYFGNCAPRKDKATARTDNEGEGLVYAKLKNGSELLVVNSGYSLSFVKPQIEVLHGTVAASKGSQFRSRDYFPGVVARCLNGDLTYRTEALNLDVIPDAPASVVAYIDSFGNLKTSIRSGDASLTTLKEGDRVRVIVGDKVRFAYVTNGSFNVPEGDIAFAPGSSGYDRPYWELFKRGGSSCLEFGNPLCGTRVEIAPA
jgi:hypothetical protein